MWLLTKHGGLEFLKSLMATSMPSAGIVEGRLQTAVLLKAVRYIEPAMAPVGKKLWEMHQKLVCREGSVMITMILYYVPRYSRTSCMQELKTSRIWQKYGEQAMDLIGNPWSNMVLEEKIDIYGE